MNLDNFNNTQIFEKISAGDLSGLSQLIALQVNVNQIWEEEETTPLIEAIKLGWLEGITLLIQAGADVNLACDIQTPKPLGVAQNMGNLEIIKLLLMRGADPNCGGSLESPPLFDAVGMVQVDIVKTLIKAGAIVDLLNVAGETPLMCAAYTGRLDLVKILLEAGANANIVNEDTEKTALVMAADNGHQDVFDYLFPLTTCPFQRKYAQEQLPSGIILKQRRDNKLLCDLIQAAKEGNINVVNEAIASGADVNAFGVDGESAFHAAVHRGNEAIIKILLDAGADIEKLTEYNQSNPLTIAASTGNFEAVNTLIKAGANYNIIIDNKTPLMIAAVLGGVVGDTLEVMKVLIRAGADINTKNSNGWTALMYAASRNNKEAVKMLISAGADVNAKTSDGWTALMKAAHSLLNPKEIVKNLISAGADINAKDNNGWTATMRMAKSRHLEAYNFLVSAGADIEAKNHEGLDAQYYLDLALAEIPF